MKHVLSYILAGLMICLSIQPAAASDFVWHDNDVIVFFGDSYHADDDSLGAGNITGYRGFEYWMSGLILENPDLLFWFLNNSRSGGTMDDAWTNREEMSGLPFWAHDFNTDHHIGMIWPTENGALTTNQMFTAVSNMMQAPALWHNGLQMTNEAGWCVGKSISWISSGQIPSSAADGGKTTHMIYNDAAYQAALQFGAAGIDLWHPLSLSWTNDTRDTGGTNVQFCAAPKGGHFLSGGALSYAIETRRQLNGGDTNISTATVDWNGSVVATNHNVIINVVRSGNSLTFQRLDLRLPGAFDARNTTSGITNEATGAFVLRPSDADSVRYTLKMTNLDAGTYQIKVGGVVIATLDASVLTSQYGWNMFTNTVGPIWDQRAEVLGRIRDWDHVNRITLIPGSAGDGVGAVSYGSTANAKWQAGYRGDALITQMAAKNTQSATNFASIKLAAQPVLRDWEIIQVVPRYAPFRR